jgi:4a-hydroxytetrahydrobiopterin dehydratase
MVASPTPMRPVRSALTGAQIVAKLSQLQGWRLSGDGADLAIEKTYAFKGYLHTIAFVNAVAFLAEQCDHHPDLQVAYKTCSVRWHTHDVKGLSHTDFECAGKVDALLNETSAPGPAIG